MSQFITQLVNAKSREQINRVILSFDAKTIRNAIHQSEMKNIIGTFNRHELVKLLVDRNYISRLPMLYLYALTYGLTLVWPTKMFWSATNLPAHELDISNDGFMWISYTITAAPF